MPTAVRSYGKINVGLMIGAEREDGFHELRTIYQTIALHDVLRVDVQRGTGIEVRCKDPRVPTHETNSCYRIAERVMRLAKRRAKVVITIDKKLPVQGGLGGASSNGVATLLALERELAGGVGKPSGGSGRPSATRGESTDSLLTPEDKLRLAAEVG